MAKVLMKGTEAIAEAAIQAGCRYFYGYPITPQNEIPEYMSSRLPQVGGVFLQCESEVASINALMGGATTGYRAMTTSSSPGISLMAEGMSYIAMGELPCVIVNVMRAGPGLGGILPAQGDYFQATRNAGHGDYRMIVLAPDNLLVRIRGRASPSAPGWRPSRRGRLYRGSVLPSRWKLLPSPAISARSTWWIS